MPWRLVDQPRRKLTDFKLPRPRHPFNSSPRRSFALFPPSFGVSTSRAADDTSSSRFSEISLHRVARPSVRRPANERTDESRLKRTRPGSRERTEPGQENRPRVERRGGGGQCDSDSDSVSERDRQRRRFFHALRKRHIAVGCRAGNISRR